MDWARDIATHLRLLVAIHVGTSFTTILSLLRDVVHLGARASAAEVFFSVGGVAVSGNLGIACVVLTPMADARDWAIWFVWARRFLRFSVRRTVLAFCTAVQGGCDLDPLAVLHDWFWR